MIKLILILALLLIPLPSLAFNVTLPYSNDFDTDQDLADVYNWDSAGHSIVYTREATGGYGDSGSCIKGVLSDHGSDDQSGLGQIFWGDEDVGNDEDQINIGYMINIGPDFTSATDNTHHKSLLLWGGTAGDGYVRPMLTYREYYSDYQTVAPCCSAAGPCTFYGNSQDNPDGSDTYQMDDYVGEWVWIEFEVIAGTHARLYVYTQDGSLSGAYSTTTDATANAAILATHGIDLLWGYWEGVTGATADSYIKLDNLRISTSFIGPPAGFISGDVDGACGSADGGTFSSIPTSNLCSTGTATTVTMVSTTYSWDCEGTGTGTDDSCTATYQAASGDTGLPFTSSFEDGTTSTEWPLGGQGTFTTTTTGNPPDGSYAVYASLTSGTHSDNYLDFVFGDHVNATSEDIVEEVWLEVESKFETGYTWPSDSQKIILLNLTDGSSTQRRYQVIIQVDSDGEYVVDNTDIGDWTFHGNSQNTNLPATDVTFDQWDNLKLHVSLNTSGSANGVVQLWINDVLKIDYSNVDIRESTSYGINKLILSTYATDSSGSNGTQWHDDVMLTDVDPGWSNINMHCTGGTASAIGGTVGVTVQ